MSGETGGCQCGAIRFRITGKLGRASICHCRMCQKATGGFFGPYVSASVTEMVWTRGGLKHFQSSNKVRRGFCEACGTPMTYEWSDHTIEISIGAFDDPAPIAPVIQMATESAVPWFGALADLPVKTAEESMAMAAHYRGIISHQHPDHDTDRP